MIAKGSEDWREFDQLYHSYMTKPDIFNKFSSYMKNSKLFLAMQGPIDMQTFKDLMYAENYILIDSEAIRAEYTYYVYFKHLPEHEAYFNRNSFLS